jgi:DNA helicase II / ATP-dependent DNA helicase PcrA
MAQELDVVLEVLGRSIVLNASDGVPARWAGRAEVAVKGPDAIAELHDAWANRQPVIIRLLEDPAVWRRPESVSDEPWRLSPSFDLPSDRLHHLIWANSYDGRGGVVEPVWWWARKAARLGAVETPEGPADVSLPNGSTVWIDGGPRGPLPIACVHTESIELGSLRVAPASCEPQPEIALAPDQLAAVSHGSGPARIIAPAGSGKTRVLTERLRHLLGDRVVERELVCAVAYNRRAQEELAQRCAAFRPRVVTLNALGWELLGRPKVLEEREVRRIIEGIVPKPAHRANVDPYGPYIEALSRIRLGLVDPAIVEEERDDVPGIAESFAPYRAALQDRGAVDFDEQIYSAIERLLRDGDFRRAQQARHRHLLVDEFQDLTPAHVLMLRLLAMPTLDVFGVGDDDQVIYGHAGADPQFLLDYGSLFPGAAFYPLEVNYRCQPETVDAARSLLGHNRRRIAKEIRAGRQSTATVTGDQSFAIETHSAQSGAQRLVEIVRAQIVAGRAPHDIAVLTRVNSLLLAPQVALGEARVVVEGALDERVLDRTGARAALAYLRIATKPDGFAAADVREVLRRPSRGLPQWIDKWFRTPTLTVRELRGIAGRLDDAKVSVKVEALADDLDLVIRAARSGTTREVLRTIKVRVGLGQAMTLLDESASGSHLDDLEALEQVADLHTDPSGFEPWLRSVLAATRGGGGGSGSGSGSGSGVTLATVHKVKGQEWPCVIVFGATEGLMPHRLSEDVEEERRVLHVAITRGVDEVIVMGDAERPSPFLPELDPATPVAAPRLVTSTLHGARTGSASSTGSAAASSAAGGARRGGVKSSSTSSASAPAGPPQNPELLEALRAWRSARAKSDGVPAYVVMHDKHLQAIAAAKPATLQALARVEGMGARRIELYGDEILERVAQAS